MLFGLLLQIHILVTESLNVMQKVLLCIFMDVFLIFENNHVSSHRLLFSFILCSLSLNI